ncbi:protein of unknown function [Pedobacter terrae]|uniref:DUF5013 domain-containing protein n=1 Tax=Pedobacter terrae TaxID=405671 RepID=A0A1G8DMD3_9SPHI|nr:DUF4998 domain-containing protein [Pedobacter terrae]SDH58864.1 protein of unknown function [Pedobacter terrae]
MNNYNIKYSKIKVLFALLLAAILYSACTKQDDFKKFVEGGEISYTGKLDSVKMFSGDSRVLLTGLFLADPKVVKCKITWNNGKDSVVLPVVKKNAIDTLIYSIPNVAEGLQNFTIYTYDKVGNKSVPVYANARSYGDRYKASLSNRPISSVTADASTGKGIISWLGMDKLTGVFATEVQYTSTNNVIKKIRTKIDSTSTTIPDLKAGTDIQYRTLFLPDTSCVDTFRTAFQTQRVLLDYTGYFKNSGNPFVSDGGSGRWRVLKDWVVSASVKNHGGYGSWCSDQGGTLAMEMGWSNTAAIVDGKIYQSLTLPAGKYNFGIDIGANEAIDPVYIVAAVGNTLPNVNSISTAIAYTNFADKNLQFTLTQPTTVSIGFLATMTTGNQYWVVKGISLKTL